MGTSHDIKQQKKHARWFTKLVRPSVGNVLDAVPKKGDAKFVIVVRIRAGSAKAVIIGAGWELLSLILRVQMFKVKRSLGCLLITKRPFPWVISAGAASGLQATVTELTSIHPKLVGL